MKKVKTLILVTYNHYNNEDYSHEIIVESEKDFKRWLKERNKERLRDGEIEEYESEFSLQYLNLIKY